MGISVSQDGHSYTISRQVAPVGVPGINIQTVFNALKLNAAPGLSGIEVQDGQTYTLTGGNQITVSVDPGNFSITNATVPDKHIFDDGTVTRQVVIMDGYYNIVTTGVGINVRYQELGDLLNAVTALPIWYALDNQISAQVISINQSAVELKLLQNGDLPDLPQCFLAGTPILMADGTEKPIEEIKPGDEVMAFDGGDSQGLGPTVPKKVTRLFRNVTKSIIDLRGLRMTPGHRVLSDNGDWLTIADVLRLDRGIVEERKTGAVLVRARTGAVIGSLEDRPIRVHFVDQKTGRQHYAIVRAGIPALAKYLTPTKAEVWTLARVLLHEGYTVSPDGWMTLPSGQRFNATPWPASSPFETEMMLNWIISVDGAPYTPPWIADINEDEERQAVNAGFSQPHSATSFRQMNPASGRPLNRADRRRQQASFRVVK